MAGLGCLGITSSPGRAATTFTPATACHQSGDTITCAGDLSSGVDVDTTAPDSVSTLIVSSQSPVGATGPTAISFQSDGLIFITSDAVLVSPAAAGIYATTSAALHGGDVTVKQTGHINAQAEGIFASSGDEHSHASGDVTVTQTGNIHAHDSGIYIQSTAGEHSGAAGDVTVTQTGNITAELDGINVGSGAGENGTAGRITVTQTGMITTQQDGISAISGGGVFLGAAGDVTITQTGNIIAQGNGIYVVSAAGADNATAGNVIVRQTGNIITRGTAINVSSSGGKDGTSGRVTVAQRGSISTEIDNAFGISAYSSNNDARNGTSGDVSVTQTGRLTTKGKDAFGIEAYSALEGQGSAGSVSVTQTGVLTTRGDGAFGIKAASTVEDGMARDVTVKQSGAIETEGDDAYGIKATSTSFGVQAGAVTVIQSGRIVTSGSDAFGINAETFTNGAGSAVTVTQVGDIVTSGDGAYGIWASSIGLTDGGNVTVTQTGNITVKGDDAFGILASSSVSDRSQSTGGSPGNVTVIQTGDILVQSNRGIDASSTVGQGPSGNVTVKQVGNITVEGTGTDGIRASSQSDVHAGRVIVDQTGNISALDIGITALSAALQPDGVGGDVTVSQSGNITAGLDGIKATSSGALSGPAGRVTVNHTGTIASGNNGISAGIFGRSGSGSIVVNLTDSTIDGGRGAAAGVRLEGLAGSAVKLNTYGITSLSARSGTAISATDGDEALNNFGTLTIADRIDLGGGSNAVNNMAGATFNSGAVIDLGSGRFTNAGTLSPGGAEAITTTSITGDFTQTSTGQLLTDVSLIDASSDLTAITGKAALAGNVRVRATDIALGPQQVTLFSATEGTTHNRLGLIASPALNARLLFPNASDVALATRLDFVPDGARLNHNQTNLANGLNAAAAMQSSGLDPLLLALVNGPVNLTEYTSALNQLLPAIFLNSESASLLTSAEFSNDLFSCNVAGTGTAFIRQSECVWVRPKSRRFDFDGTSEDLAYEDRTTGISAGAQVRIAPDWFATVALGYDSGDTKTATGAQADSDTYQVGAGLKYQAGNLLLAGAISGGFADVETMRTIAFPGFETAVARSDPSISFITGQVRAAYLVDFNAWYAKPLIDARLTHPDREAATERGGGTANLWIAAANETSVSISPAVEFGTEFALGAGAAIKPFLKTGVTYLPETRSSLSAGFVAAGHGVSGFTIDSDMDDLFADLEAGVQMFEQAGSSLSFGYKETISDNSRQNGVFAKGTLKF